MMPDQITIVTASGKAAMRIFNDMKPEAAYVWSSRITSFVEKDGEFFVTLFDNNEYFLPVDTQVTCIFKTEMIINPKYDTVLTF